MLGQWYATAVFWKPQVALFVNESTLLPVLMPLAPQRPCWPDSLSRSPRCSPRTEPQARSSGAELQQMHDHRLAKTRRSGHRPESKAGHH
jgi:hypothetical protein